MAYRSQHQNQVRGQRQRHQQEDRDDRPRTIPPAAYIQSYEAQLVYGQSTLANELATRAEDLPESSSSRGRGLIRWHGDHDANFWADRHDMVHLLASLPGPSRNARARSSSPSSSDSEGSCSSSWSSLPSDAEETFYLSGDEDWERYEREKRTKWVARLREERLREREEEDRRDEKERSAALPPNHPDKWDPDEEPSEGILTMMKHTASSLLASPNPRQLESRILTNHASDERFAFLRGRYSHTWARVKDQVKREKMGDPERKKIEVKVVGALVGAYDSSDESDEVSSPPPPPEGDAPPPPEEIPPPPPTVRAEGGAEGGVTAQDPIDEAEKQRLRRLKLEEWKRKRAAGA